MPSCGTASSWPVCETGGAGCRVAGASECEYMRSGRELAMVRKSTVEVHRVVGNGRLIAIVDGSRSRYGSDPTRPDTLLVPNSRESLRLSSSDPRTRLPGRLRVPAASGSRGWYGLPACSLHILTARKAYPAHPRATSVGCSCARRARMMTNHCSNRVAGQLVRLASWLPSPMATVGWRASSSAASPGPTT